MTLYSTRNHMLILLYDTPDNLWCNIDVINESYLRNFRTIPEIRWKNGFIKRYNQIKIWFSINKSNYWGHWEIGQTLNASLLRKRWLFSDCKVWLLEKRHWRYWILNFLFASRYIVPKALLLLTTFDLTSVFHFKYDNHL